MNDPLDLLLADGVIDEVLGQLKSGKEANIWLVRRGEHVIAAKVYKDRATRSFKNNADYKEGRKVRNSRTQRAIESGGRFGRDAAEQAWKSAEADALYRLAGSGVRVPAPVMFYEGVLLMEIVRDAEGRPAPRLIDSAIDRDAAIGVYADLVAQMISMLCCDLIHGDLSPYNILASADGPTIIDFPQVISAVHSSRAEFFFLRDFDNVVRFLSGFDPSLAVHTADGRAIWRAYVGRELTPQFVPPPPPPPRATRGPDRRGRPADDRGRSQPRFDPRGSRADRGPGRQGPPPPGSHPPGPHPSGGRPSGPRASGPPPPGPGREWQPPPQGGPSRQPSQPRPPQGGPSRQPSQPRPPQGGPSRLPSQPRPPQGGPSRQPSQPRSSSQPPSRPRGEPGGASSSSSPAWPGPRPGGPAPSKSRGARRRPKRHW
jgi:RIO kinase 1